jgi:hypothetical protein
LALTRERVQAAMLEAEANLIKANNDTKRFGLTKMVEEAKILLMPLMSIYALTKSWYMMIRDRISNEMMSTQEPSMVPPVMEEPLVMEEPPMMEETGVEEVVPPAI